MLGFGALRSPVGGGKGNAPKTRRRLEELDGHFGIGGLPSFNLNHPAHLLVTRFEVTDGQQLADMNMKRFGGDDQSAMYVDDDRMDFFRECVATGANAANENANEKPDALAAPLRRDVFRLDLG